MPCPYLRDNAHGQRNSPRRRDVVDVCPLRWASFCWKERASSEREFAVVSSLSHTRLASTGTVHQRSSQAKPPISGVFSLYISVLASINIHLIPTKYELGQSHAWHITKCAQRLTTEHSDDPGSEKSCRATVFHQIEGLEEFMAAFELRIDRCYDRQRDPGSWRKISLRMCRRDHESDFHVRLLQVARKRFLHQRTG